MVEQLSGDLTALRDSFNSYLEQLGGLQGPDAEEVRGGATVRWAPGVASGRGGLCGIEATAGAQGCL
jgi:hypothetical protein